VHDPQSLGLYAIKARGGQCQAACLGQANSLDHKRGNLRRQQAQAGFRQAELRLVIGDGDIAHARQAKTAAQHRALQHHDHHLRHGFHCLQQGAKRPVQRLELIARRDQVFHVSPGAKVPARAADHHGPRLAVQLRQHAAQFIDHFQAHRIAAFRAV